MFIPSKGKPVARQIILSVVCRITAPTCVWMVTTAMFVQEAVMAVQVGMTYKMARPDWAPFGTAEIVNVGGLVVLSTVLVTS